MHESSSNWKQRQRNAHLDLMSKSSKFSEYGLHSRDAMLLYIQHVLKDMQLTYG
jgi:hypothetical protein